MKSQLVLPMSVYVFYIFILGVKNLGTRMRAIKKGEVSPRYFKALVGETPPHHVLNIGRHYDNQFQLPMLFFITCLTCLNLDLITGVTVGGAWAFVVTRFAHSFIHLGRNFVPARVVAFVLGWFALLAIWVQICLSTF